MLDPQAARPPSDNGREAEITGFSEWDVENLRLTIFHPNRDPQGGLWRELVGAHPTSTDYRHQERVVLEHGDVSGNKLFLASQSERLDWQIQAPPPEGPGATIPTLVDVPGGMKLLQGALVASLPGIGPVQRLALGAILVQTVKDTDDGFKVLSRHLPRLELETNGPRNFVYQTNRRRRSSSVSHVQVNRLAKWSLEENQTGLISIGPRGPSLAPPSSFFARQANPRHQFC